MQQRSHRILYELHSWVGVLSAIVLFIISFSGVVALFDHEVTQWEHKEHRIDYQPDAPLDVDGLIAPILAKENIDPSKLFFIRLPSYYHPTMQLTWSDRFTDQIVRQEINPTTGELLPQSGRDTSELLRRMHTDLLLPSPIGRYFIGFMGLLMLLSLISGVIIHKKIFKEMFKFRVNRSRRLFWTDLHKAIGVWPLPFHLMIAFTGVLLGLNGVLLKVGAVAAFNGDIEAAVHSVVGEEPVMTGERYMRLPANQLIARFSETFPDQKPVGLSVEGFGDRGAHVEVQGEINDSLALFVTTKYRSGDGEVIKVLDPVADSGPFMRAYFSVMPLHYALYGGFLIKVLYFFLGLSLCFMMVTGTVIWQVRESQRGKNRQLLIRLTTGVCVGILVATIAIFYAEKLLPQSLFPDQRYYWIGLVYFTVWILSLCWVFCRHHILAALELLLFSGVMALGLPLLNNWVSSGVPFSVATYSILPVLITDVSFLVLGIALVGLSVTIGRYYRQSV